MRRGPRVAALLVAALVAFSAAPLARAQQQDPQSQQGAQSEPKETLLHERLGGAIRGFFQSIFGDSKPPAREGDLPAQPEPAPAQDSQPDKGAAARDAEPPAATAPAATTPAAPTPAPAVVATPSASATQSLHSAIGKGDYAAAIKMIEAGQDVEAKDPGAGATALHYAVMKGEMPLVALLVQRGADVNSRTKSGTTPLHTAVLYRRTEIAEYLIQKGADVNAKSPSGATPLGLAIAANYHTLAMMLRSRGGR
jgi:Ankyrin repeats (3 copies)